jgi:hypothetical protein
MSNFTTSKLENVERIPALTDNKGEEPFLLRKATAQDIPYLIQLSNKEKVKPYNEVGLYHGPEYWQWTVCDIFDIVPEEERNQLGFWGIRYTQIVVDRATGQDVGFTVVSDHFGMKLEVLALEDTVILKDALYPILRQLVAHRKKHLEVLKELVPANESAKINTTSFPMLLQIHPDHLAAQLLGPLITPLQNGPEFRYFVRIHDYPRFIDLIAPELEKRLARSPMTGTTGRLRLDFYRKVEGNSAKGLEIVLEKGQDRQNQCLGQPRS